MPAPNSQYEVKEIPITIAGGTHYGRYPKISDEATWNAIVSDGFLVPYAGYKNILDLFPDAEGRGIYASYRGNFMLVVIGSNLVRINYFTPNFYAQPIEVLQTNSGDVYIAENNNAEIIITDTQFIYVYNWNTGLFYSNSPAYDNVIASWNTAGFQNPGYVSFLNGQFIVALEGTTNWVLSDFNNAADDLLIPTASWSNSAAFVGSLQSKPDFIQAVVPVPGGSQNVLVFGHNVAESWQSTGTALFPFQKNSTFNSDFGCINPSTISSLKDFIVWIAVNEQSGPVLMTSTGNSVKPISTDGIDYKIGNLTNPSNCTGFLFQQDGHLIYQFTFPDDNLSYAYDFETQMFFNVSDESLNYHIARQVVYFGPTNTYYFVSLNGGNIYEFNTAYPDADYGNDNIRLLPRIRITAPLRLPSQRMFIIKSFGFTIENGEPNRVTETTFYGQTAYTDLLTEDEDIILTEAGDVLAADADSVPVPLASYTTSESKVYLAISRDGGVSFGNFYPLNMNPTGKRKSRLIWQRLGQANDCTFQIRFVGPIRFIATDGLAEIYQ